MFKGYGAPATKEIVEYTLCKHFKWTPNELRALPEHTVDIFLTILNQENNVKQQQWQKENSKQS